MQGGRQAVNHECCSSRNNVLVKAISEAYEFVSYGVGRADAARAGVAALVGPPANRRGHGERFGTPVGPAASTHWQLCLPALREAVCLPDWMSIAAEPAAGWPLCCLKRGTGRAKHMELR